MITSHDPGGAISGAVENLADPSSHEAVPDARAVSDSTSLRATISDASGQKLESPTGDLARTKLALPNAHSFLEPGALLGRLYRIVRHIGSGSQGDVFEVEHIRLGTKFAAKVLRPAIDVDARLIARLEREAISASKIEHPSIARVVNLDQTEDGQTFVIMELLRGETLEDVLARGPLPLRDACMIALDVTSALDAAHSAGIVHRDLKPANVFLAETAVGRIAKITDFGLSKIIEASDLPKLTQTGSVLGTPIYMSPEQVTQGEALDGRSDIYSLGVVLFEMLTGEPPFAGPGVVDLFQQHVYDPAPDPRSLRTEIPEELSQIVLKALRKKPADRPSKMSEIADALSKVVAALPESVPGDRKITPRYIGRAQARPDELNPPAPIAEPAPEPRRETRDRGPRSDPNVGRVLVGRYRIEKLIASGGMGRVYLATQMPLERPVAVKLLGHGRGGKPDPEFVQRFCVEASILARLAHPNIVTVHDYGEADSAGDLFMAMEYLDGDPLSDVIRAGHALPSDRVIDIALQICRGLHMAHAQGVIHRDLKPGNIMLLRRRDDDSPAYVKVLDFGLLKLFETGQTPPSRSHDSKPLGITRAGKIIGSPRYMAPEQIDSQPVDPRTDIYALGVIMYEMTAGRPLFEAKTEFAMFHQHLFDAPPPIAGCPPELERVVLRCLEKSPNDRYPSMVELMQELKAAGKLISGHSMSSGPHSVADALAELRPTLDSSSLKKDAGAAPPSGAFVAKSLDRPAVDSAASTIEGASTEMHARALVGDAEQAYRDLEGVSMVPARRPRNAPRSMILLLVASIVSIAAIFLLWPRAPRTDAPPSPVIERAAAVPEKPLEESHELYIESAPSGATVTEGGRTLGVTPLRIVLGSGRPRDFVLSLAGYATKPIHQEPPRGDIRMVVSLVPLTPPLPQGAGAKALRQPEAPGREKRGDRGRSTSRPGSSPPPAGQAPDIRLER